MNLRYALLLSLVFSFMGCSSSQDLTRRVAGDVSSEQRELSAGYSLLYDLLSQQKMVDGVMFIRSFEKETELIIKDIAQLSKENEEYIQDLRQELAGEGIVLDAPSLPATEAAARAIIKEQTTKALLVGGKAERDLLLSQAKSMNYLSALATDLSQRDKNSARRDWLKKLADQADQLHARVVERIYIKGADEND